MCRIRRATEAHTQILVVGTAKSEFAHGYTRPIEDGTKCVTGKMLSAARIVTRIGNKPERYKIRALSRGRGFFLLALQTSNSRRAASTLIIPAPTSVASLSARSDCDSCTASTSERLKRAINESKPTATATPAPAPFHRTRHPLRSTHDTSVSPNPSPTAVHERSTLLGTIRMVARVLR